MAQPYSIMISGVAMAVMTMIPGMPVVQLGMVSVGLLASGYYLSRKIQAEPALLGAAVYQEAEGEQAALEEAAAALSLIHI